MYFQMYVFASFSDLPLLIKSSMFSSNLSFSLFRNSSVITGCRYSETSRDPLRMSAAFQRCDFRNSRVTLPANTKIAL